MAVDSRSKRASSVQILMPWVIAPVLPDGTISQADRQHIAYAYSGILAIAPDVTSPGRTYIVPFEDRTYTVPTDRNRTYVVPADRNRTYTVPQKDDR